MYGYSMNIGGVPEIDRSASVVASPATFLAISFTLPVRRLMSPTSVRVKVNRRSSSTFSTTTPSLGFSLMLFMNLQRHSRQVTCCRKLLLIGQFYTRFNGRKIFQLECVIIKEENLTKKKRKRKRKRKEKLKLKNVARSRSTLKHNFRDKVNKKLSCRRQTARYFGSLNILPSHSRSLKVIRNDTLEQGVCKSLLVSYHFTERQIIACP